MKVDAAEVEVVKDILRTLSKTLKTFTTYPKGNPIYQKFADEISEKFNAFFEDHDTLKLEVQQNSLLYEGVDVYRSEQRSDNLALMLFADGVREITFHEDLDSHEISDFIDILRVSPFGADLQDDIVTLLWEKNIPHLSYEVAEETVEEDAVEEVGITPEAEGETGTLHGAFYSDLTIKRPALGLRMPPLTENDTSNIREELFRLEGESLVGAAVDLFLDILENEKAMHEIINGVGRIIEIKLAENDIKGALRLLKHLKEIADPAHVEPILTMAGNMANIKKAFELSGDHEELGKYLSLLGPDSIPNMIEVLGDLQDRKQRRMLCNVLVELGRDNVDAFKAAMSDKRWFLVRNVVMVMGLIKNPAAVAYIEKAMSHQEPRVRREAVRALESILTPETKKPLLMALRDTDSTIRSQGLRAIRKLGGRDVYESIKALMNRDDFNKRPYTEKKEMLEALAATGGRESFPVLAGLFKKKGIFEKDEQVETRASAASGLGVLATPEAVALLRDGAKAGKSMLKEACIKALKEAQRAVEAARAAKAAKAEGAAEAGEPGEDK